MILPGTTYRTNINLKVTGTIHFKYPFSGGFECNISKGEEFKISISTDPTDNLIQVWLLSPKKYENQIIDIETLNSPFYDSFSLTIQRSEIENNCQIITDFEKAIYFYSTLDQYGEFSNFSDYGFEYNDLYYPTVEHFYQSHKISNKEYSELIRKSKSPKDASTLGKSREVSLKDNWEDIKSDVMTLGIKRKFETHDSLRHLLLSTGEALLIENSPYDNYWGIGQTGNGLNQLGTILMRIRTLLL